MSDKPRTWTLVPKDEPGFHGDVVDDGPILRRDEEVPVVELEPVLDLLKALLAGIVEGNVRRPNVAAVRQAAMLLCEHGRPK